MIFDFTFQSFVDFTTENPLMNSSSRTIHPVDLSLLVGAVHAETGPLITPPVNPEITGFTIVPTTEYGVDDVE